MEYCEPGLRTALGESEQVRKHPWESCLFHTLKRFCGVKTRTFASAGGELEDKLLFIQS